MIYSMLELEVVGYAVVYVLAVTRLTMLVAADEITAPLRHGLLSRLDVNRPVHRKLAYLAGGASDDGTGCPWCLSIWVAGILVPAAWWWYDSLWLLVPALVLAASQITGMISGIGRG